MVHFRRAEEESGRPERDEAREERIRDEAIVDAYGPEEQAMGWYYYLQDRIRFPFRARCTDERRVSPLRVGEKVKVSGMADERDCERDMIVLIQWGDRTLGVPLSQLEPIRVDEESEQAIGDWHYWTGRGYQIG